MFLLILHMTKRNKRNYFAEEKEKKKKTPEDGHMIVPKRIKIIRS